MLRVVPFVFLRTVGFVPGGLMGPGFGILTLLIAGMLSAFSGILVIFSGILVIFG